MSGKLLMNNIKKFAVRHRLALAALGLAAAILFVLSWSGYNFHHVVKNTCEYKIIHDEYVEKQTLYPQDPAQGLVQKLPAGQGESLYGLRLMFATKGRVAQGSFTLQILQDGTVAAQTTKDMTMLLDGAFVDVLLDAPIQLEPEKSYTAKISFAPQTPEDVAGLVYGTGEMADAALPLYEEGGAAAPAKTAALQYITNYTGSSFGLRFFVLAAALIFLTLMAGWWLIYKRRAAAHVSFAVLALGLGLAWAFITPPLAGPDEYVHVAAAYDAVNRLAGEAAASEDGLMMRACDAAYMQDVSGQIGAMAYKNELDNLFLTGNSGEIDTLAQVRPPYMMQPVQYLGQIAGILTARILGLSFFAMLILGRIGNLLIYVFLAAMAVKIVPAGKNIFYAVGALPACLSLAGSFSADPTVIGIALLFTALCLKARQGEAKLLPGEIAGLIVLSVLLAPAKAVYLPIVFLCLIIPAEALGGKQKAAWVKTAIIGAGALGWLLANGETALYLLRGFDKDYAAAAAAAVIGAGIIVAALKKWGKNPLLRKALRFGILIMVLLAVAGMILMLRNSGTGVQLTPEEYAQSIQPNGESIYTFSLSYIMMNVPQTVKLLMNTLSTQLPVYLQGLIGALPGEPIVHQLELSWLLVLSLVLVLLLSCLGRENENRLLDKKAVWCFAAEIILVCGLTALAAVNWTPINSTVVFGIQGRYLLPILPMLLLIVNRQNTVVLKKDISRGIQLGCGLLSAGAAMEAFVLFAAG